jgi:hypothetical protein
MKKLLGSVLALAFVVITSQANAELLKNFKFSGSVEMSAVSARNVLDFNTKLNDRIGDAQTRVMLGMDWDLLDDVHAKVSMYKNNRVYGQNTGAGQQGEETLNDVQNAVAVSQAYFKIDKVFGFLDSTFGRQYYGEAGDLIAAWGPKMNEYGMMVTAIDGARFDWTGEKAYAQVLVVRPAAGLNASGNYGATLNGQVDVRGFIVGNKGNENIDAKVYVWNQATHNDQDATANPNAKPGANDNLYIPGFKVKAKFGGLYGSLEAALNFGENRTYVGAVETSERYAGKALLADAGFKADVEQIGMFNPWAQFGYGSGNGDPANANNHNMDFQTIATDFRPGAIYGRFDTNASLKAGQNVNAILESNGLQNRIIWGIGVKATPAALNKLTAGVAYYDYKLQNRQVTGDALKGNRHIGSEFDVTAEWKHSENVSIKGTLGDFQAGGAIKNVNGAAVKGNNPALMSALDVCVKF